MFNLLLAGPFFYDPHMRKRHLDILSPSTWQFRFRTTDWSKERGESQRVLDELLQAPKYEEVYYTFTTCNNRALNTPVCFCSVSQQGSLWQHCRNKQYPVFGRGCLWQAPVWQQCQVGWRSHPFNQENKGAGVGPGNNTGSFWRPDDSLELKQLCSLLLVRAVSKKHRTMDGSLGGISQLLPPTGPRQLYRNVMVRNRSTLPNTGPGDCRTCNSASWAALHRNVLTAGICLVGGSARKEQGAHSGAVAVLTPLRCPVCAHEL